MTEVAFGFWGCCTILAEHVNDIPERCPEHGRALIARPSWETRTPDRPLGREPALNYDEERKAFGLSDNPDDYDPHIEGHAL